MERGVETRYALWRDMSVQAKAVVNDEQEYQRLVGPLKRVRCLYIDDLFKTGKGQQPTTGDVNLAFEILNSRYNDSTKITIIRNSFRGSAIRYSSSAFTFLISESLLTIGVRVVFKLRSCWQSIRESHHSRNTSLSIRPRIF